MGGRHRAGEGIVPAKAASDVAAAARVVVPRNPRRFVGVPMESEACGRVGIAGVSGGKALMINRGRSTFSRFFYALPQTLSAAKQRG
jgi:hypothetical protein